MATMLSAVAQPPLVGGVLRPAQGHGHHVVTLQLTGASTALARCARQRSRALPDVSSAIASLRRGLPTRGTAATLYGATAASRRGAGTRCREGHQRSSGAST